jgi:hypothetical protein
MGKKALQVKKVTMRTIRKTRLSDDERRALRTTATYEGSPLHKRNPGNFGLIPPAAPRLEKTLCDEAGVCDKAVANRLLASAIERGLGSEDVIDVFPKYLWALDERGQVFEAIYGGSVRGAYHGYPIRRSDPFFDTISKLWAEG